LHTDAFVYFYTAKKMIEDCTFLQALLAVQWCDATVWKNGWRIHL